ncbi:hypothetical protein SNE40_017744 [Patella caerulea]|uniref:Calcineurin-like phosphoesterase domain-containing protein n=2 Tax=Patella caerulea TaxID=87958 RepID=A0AAN8JEF5_PATCE
MSRSLISKMRRIFAISDIHVDFKENREFVNSWSHEKYGEDVLILAGDVTDFMSLLKETLQHLSKTFYKVFYVSGNHELWIRRPEEFADSIVKFHEIISLCDSIGICTRPEKIQVTDSDCVWVCPLFSWYSTHDDDSDNSLYITAKNPESDKNAREMWMDNHLCIWSKLPSTRSEYFEKYNSKHIPPRMDSPVITFSHFVPRQDLILPNEKEKEKLNAECERLGLEVKKNENSKVNFNFSMYAGCKRIEKQIREINPIIHVYGHQHRQRDRKIDGVNYISHCLGYKKERDAGFMWGINEWNGPKLIWPIKSA